MDDLEKFLKFLFGDESGYVYVATKRDKPDGNIDWDQNFFQWPNDKDSAYNFVALEASVENQDIYIGPALYKSKSGLKSQVKGSNVVWVEFDGQEQIDFKSNDIPEPDVIIQTSTDTHRHCYWQIPFSNVDTVEDINRRLTYHLEADNTGWDANQVLRPPNSKNWKHNGLPVQLIKFSPKFKGYQTKDFDAAPIVEQPVIVVRDTELLDPEKLLKELPLHPKLRKRIISETVSGPVGDKSGARSQFLMKIGHELAEEGCKHLEIVSLLSYVDDRIGKFKNRRDKLTRLSEIAARALLYIQAETELVLYSPLDIINHTEELEWVLEGKLHRSGFVIVTGSPGVGKTTLCLQMLYHLTTQSDFLSSSINTVPRVLFISLEMNIIELQYIFRHHQKGFSDIELWNKSIRILDQEGSLIEYEEIISEYEPHVILIDSLSELAMQELKEEESRAITRWIKRIRRRYNTSVIAIHHNRKNSGSHKRATTLSDVYGSFIFGKDADTVINLELNEHDEDITDVFSLKTRYSKPFRYEFVRDPNTLLFIPNKNIVSDDSKSNISIERGTINIGFG